MELKLKDALGLENIKNLKSYTIYGASENQVLTDEPITVQLIVLYKNHNNLEVGYSRNIKISKFGYTAQDSTNVINFDTYLKNEYDEYKKPFEDRLIGGFTVIHKIPEEMFVSFEEYKNRRLPQYKAKNQFINDEMYAEKQFDDAPWDRFDKEYQNRLFEKYGKDYAVDVKQYYLNQIEIAKQKKDKEFLIKMYNGRIQSANRFIEAKDEELAK